MSSLRFEHKSKIQLLQLDSMRREILCRHSAVSFMNTIVKQIDPNLGYELEKYRSGPDDFCQEAIVLKKEALIER